MARLPRLGDHEMGQLSLEAVVDVGAEAKHNGRHTIDGSRKRAAKQARRRTTHGVETTAQRQPVTAEAERRQLLLTVDQAARELHIGRRQTWEMVWRGELPVVRLGPRTLRVAYPVLERFVLERSGSYVQ